MRWIAVLCYFLTPCITRISFQFEWTKKSDYEEREQLEEDWKELLFPDGHNPLYDNLIESSSDEEDKTVMPPRTFQSKFPGKHPGELANHPTSQQQRVNTETAEFFVNELASTVKVEWQGQAIENFGLKVLQLNLTVFNMKIIRVEFPFIRFERPYPGVLRLIGTDGIAYIKGRYRSAFKTIRHGRVDAFVYDFCVDLDLRFHSSKKSNSFYLSEMECRPAIGQIDVSLTPNLVDDAQVAIERHLWYLLQKEICTRAEDYARRTDEKLQEVERGIP